MFAFNRSLIVIHLTRILSYNLTWDNLTWDNIFCLETWTFRKIVLSPNEIDINAIYIYKYLLPSRYGRLLEPNYGDKFSTPTLAVSGDVLPSVRTTSNKIFQENYVQDQQYNLLNMQWGQVLAHDMSLLAGSAISS